MDERLIRILCALSPKQYQTSSYLALLLNLSEKTVRTRIKELEEIMISHGVKVISKQRKGYILEINDPQQYNVFLSTIHTGQSVIPINSDERVSYILNDLLWNEEYLKLDDMSARLYVSKSTLTNDIKKVEKKLNEYNIEILRKPYYGMKISGSEMDIRLCLVNQILKRNLFQKFNNNDLQYQIANILKEVVLKDNLYVSEMILHSMILHIYLAVQRIQKGYVIPNSIFLHIWADEKNFGTQEMATEIARRIKQDLGVDMPPQEIDYIAVHLVGKKMIHTNSFQEPNFIISPEIYGLANEMIQTIYESYKIDLRSHFDLRIALCKHLVPLEIRLKYDMLLENPLLEDIKKQYSYSFAIASQAIVPIVMRYEKKLDENEVGYIALILATALETKSNSEKKNILLVCSEGKYIGKLLACRYQEEFANYLNDIKVCNLSELPFMSFKNIDYILTTTPIKMNISIPILEIRAFLEDDEILNLKKEFSKNDQKNYIRYFDKHLFLPCITCFNKEDVLAYMCQEIQKYKALPNGFLEAVLEREELATTDFGEFVALPHPNTLYTQEDFACVGLLEQPVFWGVREVQCVILIAISQNVTHDFENFFFKISHFAMNKYMVSKVLETRNYNDFIDILNEG